MVNQTAPNYWLVGATWGRRDKTSEFVEQGYWMLGHDQVSSSSQVKCAKKIKPGDRIAIKRLLGRGKTQIKIRYIGIVQGVIPYSNHVICTVNWVSEVSREAPMRKNIGAISGPYKLSKEGDRDWLREIFCL